MVGRSRHPKCETPNLYPIRVGLGLTTLTQNGLGVAITISIALFSDGNLDIAFGLRLIEHERGLHVQYMSLGGSGH
jgi:hypothetical protein